jgi:hypothetical protein
MIGRRRLSDARTQFHPGAQPPPSSASYHPGKRLYDVSRRPCAFALHRRLDYDFLLPMTNSNLLHCDGCGQPASPEHIAKRLERLEWTTRYRPLHIGALLLGAVAPSAAAEFLYAPSGEFAGPAKHLLAAAGVSSERKSAEATLAEFQRGGLLLAYVLDCPVERSVTEPAAIQALLSVRLPALAARVRRSLRPKRLVPISRLLEPLLGDLEHLGLGCPIVLDGNKPFALDEDTENSAAAVVRRLRQALAVPSGAVR